MVIERAVPSASRAFFDIKGIVFEKERPRKMVNLSTLPADRKRAAWEKIQRSNPALAQLLQSDEVAQICKTFNAQVMVDKGVLS